MATFQTREQMIKQMAKDSNTKSKVGTTDKKAQTYLETVSNKKVTTTNEQKEKLRKQAEALQLARKKVPNAVTKTTTEALPKTLSEMGSEAFNNVMYLAGKVGVGAVSGVENIAKGVASTERNQIIPTVGKLAEKIPVVGAPIKLANLVSENVAKSVGNIQEGVTGTNYLTESMNAKNKIIDDFIMENKGGKLSQAVEEQFGSKTTQGIQKLGNIAEGTGGLLTTIATGGLPSMYASVYGGSYSKARQEGASDTEAKIYANLNAGKEVLTEKMFGAIPGLPKGTVSEALNKVFSNKTVRSLVDTLGEGVEEVISSAVDPILQRLTYNKGAELANIEDLSADALAGIIIGGLFQGAGKIANINMPKIEDTQVGNINTIPTEQNANLSQLQANTEQLAPNTQEIAPKIAENIVPIVTQGKEVQKMTQEQVEKELYDYVNKTYKVSDQEEVGFNRASSGYVGDKLSKNAYSSIQKGIMPLKDASKILGVSKNKIREFVSSSEWHHTGKKADETDFYNIRPYIYIKNGDIEGLKNDTEIDIDEEDIPRYVENYNAMQKMTLQQIADLKEQRKIKAKEEYEAKAPEREIKMQKLKEFQMKRIGENSTKEASDLYNELMQGEYEQSSSGTLYRKGQKPTPEQYENKTIPIGTQALKPNETNSGYTLIEYNGNEWVTPKVTKQEVTDNIMKNVSEKLDIPETMPKREIVDNVVKGVEDLIDKASNKELAKVVISKIDPKYANKRIQDVFENYGEAYKNIEQDNKIKSETNEGPIVVQKNGEVKNFVTAISDDINDETQSSKVADILTEYKKQDEKKANQLETFYTMFRNQGQAFDNLAKTSNNPEIKYKYDKLLSAAAEGQYVIGEAQTNNQGQRIGKSINEIWKPIEEAGNIDLFSDYLLHKLNIERMAQGKPVFGESITADISKKEVAQYEKNHPEFVEASKNINTFNKNQLDNLVKAGITSEEAQKTMNEMYDNYIRIQREKPIKKSPFQMFKGASARNPIQRATGGNADIKPLKESMAEQAIQVKKAIRKNDLGLEVMKSLEGLPVDTYEKTLIEKDGTYKMIVFKEGKPYAVDISENMYNGLSKERYKIEELLPFRILQKASQFQRGILTSDNLVFTMTNFAKDIQDGAFNSKYPKQFLGNYATAVVEIAGKGKWYDLLKANGGLGDTFFDSQDGFKSTQPTKFKKNPAKFTIERIRQFNEMVEQAPRLAEFISTMENGGTITEAMYNAAEITTNFKRGGYITKAINRNGVNFLNASIQGLDKTFRNFSEQPGARPYVKMLIKATLWGMAPALINQFLLGDDEDYKDLPQYVKDQYYLFKTGDNKFIRIPKGRSLATTFGNIARRSLQTVGKEDDAWKDFGKGVANQFSPVNPIEGNIISPFIQVAQNKAWHGGKIVPTRLEDEPAKEQYDERTTELSKTIGKYTGISPMKTDYILNAYTGWVGDIGMPMMTPLAENNVLSDKFTTNSIRNNKNVSMLYDLQQKLQTENKSDNPTELSIKAIKDLNKATTELSKLYNEKRKVEMVSSPDQKAKSEEIQKKINQIAKTAIANYNQQKTQGTQTVKGYSDYKANKPSEKTEDKISTIQALKITPEEKFKLYELEVFSQTPRKDGSSQLQDVQKALENGITQDQIVNAYNKLTEDGKALPSDYDKLISTIGSINSGKYEVEKSIGKSIADTKYNAYTKLKVPQEQIAKLYATKTEGAEKSDVIDNLRQLKGIDAEQKRLFLAMEYSLNKADKRLVRDYIMKQDISNAEKLEIFKTLKGFKVDSVKKTVEIE